MLPASGADTELSNPTMAHEDVAGPRLGPFTAAPLRLAALPLLRFPVLACCCNSEGGSEGGGVGRGDRLASSCGCGPPLALVGGPATMADLEAVADIGGGTGGDGSEGESEGEGSEELSQWALFSDAQR